jgi:hypothetical protein
MSEVADHKIPLPGGFRAQLLSVLSSLARFAMKRRGSRTGRWLLNDDPVERIEKPKKQRPQEKYLLAHELQATPGSARADWEHIALGLLIDTACRGRDLTPRSRVPRR